MRRRLDATCAEHRFLPELAECRRGRAEMRRRSKRLRSRPLEPHRNQRCSPKKYQTVTEVRAPAVVTQTLSKADTKQFGHRQHLHPTVGSCGHPSNDSRQPNCGPLKGLTDAADARRTGVMCRRDDSGRLASRRHIVVTANAFRKVLRIEPFTIPSAP